MKYNIEWLTNAYNKNEKKSFLFFWGHRKSKSGNLSVSCFSQWWTDPFVVDSVSYQTAEHWMMAQKALLFDDKETFEKIIIAQSPIEAKELGKQVKDFKEQLWVAKRFAIVVAGNLHKFSQNNDLKNFLLDTNDKVLVEASPVDNIWGIGLAADDDRVNNPKLWRGFNLLGFALMEVRDLLKDK